MRSCGSVGLMHADVQAGLDFAVIALHVQLVVGVLFGCVVVAARRRLEVSALKSDFLDRRFGDLPVDLPGERHHCAALDVERCLLLRMALRREAHFRKRVHGSVGCGAVAGGAGQPLSGVDEGSDEF